MAAARSAPVDRAGKVRTLPSGRVTEIGRASELTSAEDISPMIGAPAGRPGTL